MKIALNVENRDGPFGGGNRFVKDFKEYAQKNGHCVVFDLKEKDIDIIFVVDPRFRHPNSRFTSPSILFYLLFKNPNAIVVHRINECDERKGTNFMNKSLKRFNYLADHTIFIASWLKDLDLWIDESYKKSSVILNGADSRVFNRHNWSPWNKSGKMKLVTHHWSPNYMKGFDVYNMIDKLLSEKKWSEKLEFSYIGNLPKNFKFNNVNHVNPQDGYELAATLKKSHAYITASINEPGGMHQHEAALCGLPILFRDSGAFPECCGKFGLSFNKDDFVHKLEQFIDNYDYYAKRIAEYPFTSEKSISQYFLVLENLKKTMTSLSKTRRLFRDPLNLMKSLQNF